MQERPQAAVVGSPQLRLGLLVVLVAGGFVAFLLAGAPSVARIRAAVDGLGMLAPVAYTLLYAVLTVLLVPGAVLTGAAGLLFGAFGGTAVTVVGATAGATVAFAVARRLGRRGVEQLVRGRMARADRWIADRGLLAVLYVRLVPVVPFNLLNYAAGVTAVRLRHFVVGTAVGIVPGSFAYAALGGNLDDPTSPAFVGAAGLVVALAVAGPWLSRRLDPPSDEDPDGQQREDALTP